MATELPKMLDVVSPQLVEITFSQHDNGRTMWINVDDVCYMRVTNAARVDCDGLTLTRKEPTMPQGGGS